MQGTLRDFRVAEILQLVAVQQKTGLLRVQGTDTTLTARQLESEIEGSRKDLADLLLDRQIIGDDDLANVLEDLAQDLITSSYAWTDGSYLFIAGDEALQGLNHRMSRNVEGLLMEAARRADEWPRLLEKVPGPETVVGDLQRLPSGLGAATRNILEKLQQPITMHELVTQARVPEFEVYETVVQAIENDMARVLARPRLAIAPSAAKTVTLATPQNSGTPAEFSHTAAAQPRRNLGPGLRRFLLWSAAVVVMGACAVGSALQLRKNLTMATPTIQQVHAARARLEVDLEVHRAVFGAYPATLDALVEAEMTPAAILVQARIDTFRLYAGGASYRIEYLRDDS